MKLSIFILQSFLLIFLTINKFYRCHIQKYLINYINWKLVLHTLHTKLIIYSVKKKRKKKRDLSDVFQLYHSHNKLSTLSKILPPIKWSTILNHPWKAIYLFRSNNSGYYKTIVGETESYILRLSTFYQIFQLKNMKKHQSG